MNKPESAILYPMTDQPEAIDSDMTGQAPDHRQVLGRIFEELERPAYRMAQLATGDRDQALDLVQDAMLRTARRYGSGTMAAAEIKALFYRTLNNRIIDWHRREKLTGWIFGRPKPQPDEDDPDDGLLEGVTSETPEQVHDQQLLGVQIQTALQSLAAKQRQAFLLHYWQGIDTAEVASIMQCSQGSVKTHLSRARKNLQTRLQDLPWADTFADNERAR